jgi:hypothetical protein
MRFSLLQRTNFGADDGAYSVVTSREVEDSQITLTGEEVEVAEKYFGKAGIHRGNVHSDPKASSKIFILLSSDGSAREVELNLVYCKSNKPELRLYLKTNIFKPHAKEIWFIFTRAGKIYLGSMGAEQWRAIGRDDGEDETYSEAIYSEHKGVKFYKTAGGLFVSRDPSLAQKRFECSHFRCENDPRHPLFISRSSGKPFLEAHHLVAMRFQKSITTPLDNLDNIFSLCPLCHRAIHHATTKETMTILDRLYATRPTFLDKLALSMKDLIRFYNCENIT